MNRQIDQILKISEGRYLTDAEQQTFRDQAAKLEHRLSVMNALATKERAIAERTIREILKAFPDCEQKYRDALQKGTRDLMLVLRYVAQAVVRNDPEWLEQSLLAWLTTILKGIGFTPEFIGATYRTLERVATEELSPEVAELVRPYLNQVVDTLARRRVAA